MHQTTISGILRRDAGTFDLDEAAAALDHVGVGTLAAFAAEAPPLPPTPATRLAGALTERPELVAFLADLLLVPKPRLAEVIELASGIARVTTGRRGVGTPGSTSARRPARRTTTALTRRR